MADKTSIEWTRGDDGSPGSTWNIVTGCSVVSPGCTHCYAMKLAGTRLQHHPSRAGLTQETKAGPVWTGEVRFNEQWLTQPLTWKRPRRIFVAAHGDLFHEGVPDEVLDKVFAVMALAPRHTFQVLTKRAERMRRYVEGLTRQEWWKLRLAEAAQRSLRDDRGLFPDWPLPWVWLGVSAEDQQRADERIPHLLATPAAVRFLSAEPLLGPIDLREYLEGKEEHGIDMTRPVGSRVGACVGWTPSLDWVIAGAESGRGARDCDLSWARSLRDQCVAAGEAFFWKQHAAGGRKIPTPELDGRRWVEMPEARRG